VMGGDGCFFGVNFADGRVKCYPLRVHPGQGGYFALFVRGGDSYGENNFVNNGDGTINDLATGLTWTQTDNGDGVLWSEALNYCESLTMAGSDDWRLPNIKELHSVVDYSRSPDATGTAAIDPIFNLTAITNEAGQSDYPFYWSSTTLISYPNSVRDATYISFGRAMGYMEEFGGWIDVHGAGAQRSDAKAGVDPGHQLGAGPQGDARRSNNYVLCVRGGQVQPSSGDDPASLELSSDQGSSPPGGQQQQGPPGGPPQEAIDACTGLSAGTTCSVGPGSGTCETIQNQLACVPEGGPPPGGGQP